MVGHGHALAVDHQRALVALTLLIVREGRRAGDRTQEQVVGREELGPRAPHTVARLVRREPVAMRQDRGARGARIVALIADREAARDRRVLLEVRVALAVGRRGAQEPRVDGERLAGIDGRARAIVDLRLLPAQKVGQGLEPVLHLASHGDVGRVEHQGHLEVAQPPLPWRREPQLPSRRLDLVGAGHDRQRQREVVGAPRERTHHVDVDGCGLPG